MGNFFFHAFPASTGVELSTITPDVGTSWVKHGMSSSDLQTNGSTGIKEVGAGAYATYYGSDVPPSADYTVAVYVFSQLGGTLGGVARLDPSVQDYYSLVWRTDVSAWNLVAVVGASETVLGSTGSDVPNLGTISTALSVQGANIRGVINSTEYFNVTDSSVTAVGRAGLLIYNAAGLADALYAFYADSIDTYRFLLVKN